MTYKSEGGVLFNKSGDILLKYPHGNCSENPIPFGVKIVGGGSFAFCKLLTNVNIPNGVTHIEDGAFAWCNSLEHIILPESLIYIGDTVFLDCSMLKSITIPRNVEFIGSQAFKGCAQLGKVIVQSSTTRFYAPNIFVECSKKLTLSSPVEGVFSKSTAKTYAKKYGITFVAQ
jgi:hypothetical protein